MGLDFSKHIFLSNHENPHVCKYRWLFKAPLKLKRFPSTFWCRLSDCWWTTAL